MWCCNNVGGLGEHVTCHMFWFLGWTFLFVGLHRAATGRWIWTIYTSYDVFPRKGVPFGSPVVIATHLEGQKLPKPQFWGVISLTHKIIKPAYYRNGCIDSSQFLHSDKSHQVLFEQRIQYGGWSPLWKWKNCHTSATYWPIFTKFGRNTQTGPLECINFWKSKMAAAAILRNS